MIQRRKWGETAPFQTTLRTWTELLTTEHHSRPHRGAITKGRRLRMHILFGVEEHGNAPSVHLILFVPAGPSVLLRSIVEKARLVR